MGASHIARDITRAQAAGTAAAQVAAIVESSDDAIISKTLDGIILTWNAGAERVYGYPAHEMIGRPMTLLLPEDRQDEEADVLDRIRRGESVEHFETVRRTRNGSLSMSRLPSHPFATPLAGSSAHRTWRATSPNASSSRSTCGTPRSWKAWVCLAGGVAHDFNNLLTGILGNASLALESVSSAHSLHGLLQGCGQCERAGVPPDPPVARLCRQGPVFHGPSTFPRLVREISRLIQSSIPEKRRSCGSNCSTTCRWFRRMPVSCSRSS